MPKKHIDFLVAAAGVTALGIMLSLTPDRVEATRSPVAGDTHSASFPATVQKAPVAEPVAQHRGT